MNKLFPLVTLPAYGYSPRRRVAAPVTVPGGADGSSPRPPVRERAVMIVMQDMLLRNLQPIQTLCRPDQFGIHSPFTTLHLFFTRRQTDAEFTLRTPKKQQILSQGALPFFHFSFLLMILAGVSAKTRWCQIFQLLHRALSLYA